MAKAMAKTKAKTLTAYDRVKIARDAKRPHIFDFIKALCSDFEELHGDRLVNDDRALVGGFGTIGGENIPLNYNNGGFIYTFSENTELMPEETRAAAQAALDAMIAAPNTVDFSGVELK